MSGVLSEIEPSLSDTKLDDDEKVADSETEDKLIGSLSRHSGSSANEESEKDALSEERESSNVMEPLEIDQNGKAIESSDDEEDDDLEALLGENVEGRAQTRGGVKRRCCSSKRVGNVMIICPGIHRRTGCGIVGPHWVGPIVVLLLISWASEFFVRRAMHLGPISTSICVIFMISSIYNLFDTSFRDPGIVIGKPATNEDISEHRWCDFCNVYQPPDGAHCPDCNVCVSGYDHHCVWMGVCIGKGNMKPFLRFNLSWLLYLLYCIIWISILGPIMNKVS
mmetsp:Transcript_5863/g.8517  ORF Transcript_5863/g.8517 Transcript_5863/m.8517 type:complete len:280 (-) Transcript_5863:1848-2687(-)